MAAIEPTLIALTLTPTETSRFQSGGPTNDFAEGFVLGVQCTIGQVLTLPNQGEVDVKLVGSGGQPTLAEFFGIRAWTPS